MVQAPSVVVLLSPVSVFTRLFPEHYPDYVIEAAATTGTASTTGSTASTGTTTTTGNNKNKNKAAKNANRNRALRGRHFYPSLESRNEAIAEVVQRSLVEHMERALSPLMEKRSLVEREIVEKRQQLTAQLLDELSTATGTAIDIPIDRSKCTAYRIDGLCAYRAL